MMVTPTQTDERKRPNGPKDGPRYKAIREALRRQITEGTYRLMEKLPSEHTLMDQFGASRATIRKALSGLLEIGLIHSRRGEGYFVSRPSLVQDLRRLQGLSESAEEVGHCVSSKVVSACELSADKAVADALALEPGTRVFELKRLRYLNAVPLSFDVSYFPLILGRELEKCDLASADVYSLLGELLDDDLGHADFLIEVTDADCEITDALDAPVIEPLIRVTRVAYMMSGKPVDFEYIYGRPGSYRFKVRVPRW
jgi:GntR family transcriptional regulator